MIHALFPNLVAEGFRETSPENPLYNCIAWAAGRDDEWWWPDASGISFWPEDVPRVESVEAFLVACGTLGYQSCTHGSLNDQYEKIAIYVRDGKPTHAARQHADGTWSSKLGQWIDISHTLFGLDGPAYGQATVFLSR